VDDKCARNWKNLAEEIKRWSIVKTWKKVKIIWPQSVTEGLSTILESLVGLPKPKRK
jgi:hypothetical protein